MAFSSKNVDDFANQIADLETALSNRQLNALEAKIFYDHLTSVYENVKSYETQLKTSSENQSEVPSTCFITIRDIYLNTINLKIRLTKVLSSTESTSASEINIDATKQSETAKNLHLQLRKQSYFIRQMQSLETQNDICATKAEILYKHLSQLYDMFISNQIQIEANIDDDGDSLQNQQKISTKIQQIVIDCQTKLQKIIKPTESTGYKRSASYLTEQTNNLLKTSQSEQTQSSELESTLQSIQLKLSNLESLYNDLLESQPDRNEIGCNFSDIFTYLVDILEVSKEIESKMAFLEEKKQQFVDENDLIDEIMAENNRPKLKCSCIKCDPIRGRNVFPCVRNLQEMYPPIPPVPIGLRHIDIKSTSTDPSALNMAQLTSSNSNPSDQGSSKVVPPQSGDHRKFKKYGKTIPGAFKFS